MDIMNDKLGSMNLLFIANLTLDSENEVHIHYTTKTLLRVYHTSKTAASEYLDPRDPVHTLDGTFNLCLEKNLVGLVTTAMDINKK
jgi:hypothetical protein